MLKYCKIINEEKGLVQVGTGSNINFYKSIGFTLQEVEKVDGVWYLQGKVPEPDLEVLKLKKKEELKKARDEYLKQNNYDYSENDLFNIVNLIGFTQEEKDNYIAFIKDDLKVKYDTFALKIKECNNKEELDKIIIDFNGDTNEGQVQWGFWRYKRY